MKILVLGAYGFIGAAITRALTAAGHEVTGLGRTIGRAARQYSDVAWVARDLRSMSRPEDWKALLAGMDGVVNAAGVLQDGGNDDVAAVQSAAMRAMFAACVAGGPRRVVQISAVGAAHSATTAFMRTKAEADAALTATALDWLILRPGLVVGPSAYGGTAMLRGLAAFPFVLPIALPSARMQTVAVADVAAAVVMAFAGDLAWRRSIDLVEDDVHSLAELVVALRQWQGLPPARLIAIPTGVAHLIARCGDLLGWLGWRPPLRSTSLQQIEASVTGDPSAWRAITGRPLPALPAILRGMPANVQEHWFARLWLIKPVIVGALALFWLLSGIIGLWHFEAACRVLTERGVTWRVAAIAVALGIVADIGLGAAVLIRRSHIPALLGMLATTLAYLAFGTWLTPDLWGEPLGPFVKALPALVLCLVALAIAEDR